MRKAFGMRTISLASQGFSNYGAREDGVIVRLTSRTCAKAGTVLTGGRNRRGYRLVTLQHDDGRQRGVMVHLLIAAAFHGPRPDGMVCRHLDGNNVHNEPRNLKWGTPEENYEDRDVHGTTARGERHGCAKLTEADVRAIRASPLSQRRVAEAYGVSQATVSDIRLRKLWGHVV